jgi:hypothetical protein
MGYRNKTYVIFDGDNDMWAYGFMKGWKSNENMNFNFFDAHDIRPLSDRASEETIRTRLRERFSSACQVIVLVGDNTKNLYRFVRWEIEIAQKLDLPIIAANLNGLKQMDSDRCPAILRDWPAVHVPFKMKMIQHALDNFPDEYPKIKKQQGARTYPAESYKALGI